MDIYFNYIASRLDLDELKVLGTLHDNDATAIYKGIFKKTLQEKCDLSDAIFKKILTKLSARSFVEIESSTKNHKLYITDYGLSALSKSLEGEM